MGERDRMGVPNPPGRNSEAPAENLNSTACALRASDWADMRGELQGEWLGLERAEEELMLEEREAP